jgi:hypothetical protein
MAVNAGDIVLLSPVVTDEDGDTMILVYSGWKNGSSRLTSDEDLGIHTVRITADDGIDAYFLDVQISVYMPPKFEFE